MDFSDWLISIIKFPFIILGVERKEKKSRFFEFIVVKLILQVFLFPKQARVQEISLESAPGWKEESKQ